MDNNEIIFSPEDDAIFDAAWSFDELPEIDVPYFFHYRSGKSIDSIFGKDRIRLQFTRDDHFADKMEGKAVLVYYDLAIEELLNQGKITEEQYNRIINVSPPKMMLAHEKRNGINYYTEKEFDPYILCFSTEQNDPNMFNLIKRKESGCYYFSIDTTIVNCLNQVGRKNGVHIRSERVMYGREVVEHIQKKVLYMFKKPYLSSAAEVFLQDYLHKLQFVAKLSKFKNENEIRTIINVPKKLNVTHPDIIFDENREHLTLSIPKSYVFRITPKESNDKMQDKELFKELMNRGYQIASYI